MPRAYSVSGMREMTGVYVVAPSRNDDLADLRSLEDALQIEHIKARLLGRVKCPARALRMLTPLGARVRLVAELE